MKAFFNYLLLIIIWPCWPGQVWAQSALEVSREQGLPVFYAQKVALPLHLDQIDLNSKQLQMQVPDAAIPFLYAAIETFYYEACEGDSNETHFKKMDTYLGTIWLQMDTIDLYYIVLRHYPFSILNSRVLLFDNKRGHPMGPPLQHNIHALYDWHNAHFQPSNLKEVFHITKPEIGISDHDLNGIKDLTFTRLNHNGTANGIETLVIDVSHGKLDTLFFEVDWILPDR